MIILEGVDNDYLGKENVGIAFDNMVVNRFNMRLIPSMYEALKR